MCRICIALSLIVSLFLCPFRCMGKAAMTAPSRSIERCCCEHCRDSQIPTEHQSPSDRQFPADRNSDSGYCDCICAGAMLPSSISRGQATLDVNALATIVAVTHMGIVGVDGTFAETEGPPLHLAVAGRALRLSIKSLQV